MVDAVVDVVVDVEVDAVPEAAEPVEPREVPRLSLSLTGIKVSSLREQRKMLS